MCSEYSAWFGEHSTPNPTGVRPDTRPKHEGGAGTLLLKGSKFMPARLLEAEKRLSWAKASAGLGLRPGLGLGPRDVDDHDVFEFVGQTALARALHGPLAQARDYDELEREVLTRPQISAQWCIPADHAHAFKLPLRCAGPCARGLQEQLESARVSAGRAAAAAPKTMQLLTLTPRLH